MLKFYHFVCNSDNGLFSYLFNIGEVVGISGFYHIISFSIHLVRRLCHSRISYLKQ